MIDVSARWAEHETPDGIARYCLFLPSIALTWFPGQSSYALTLAWLSWSATLAWGKGTRP